MANFQFGFQFPKLNKVKKKKINLCAKVLRINNDSIFFFLRRTFNVNLRKFAKMMEDQLEWPLFQPDLMEANQALGKLHQSTF